VRRFLPELAAAVLGPVAFLAYTSVRGWEVGISWGTYVGVSLPDVLAQVVPFVAGGALVAVWGWRCGLLVVPVLLPFGMVTTTFQPAPVPPASVTTLAVPLWIVVVLGVNLSFVEYALLDRGRIEEYYTRRSLLAGATAGMVPVVYVLWTLSNAGVDFSASPSVGTLGVAVWVGTGLFLLFGLPVSLLVHRRLFSPLIVTCSIFVWHVFQLFQGEGARWFPYLVALYWLLPLTVGLLAGAGESLLRRRYERSRDEDDPSNVTEG
jgi:hypothetical protein